MPADDGSDLVIIIVNYRAGPLVVDCLASLAPQIAEHPATKVLVVDNASGDASARTIEAAIALNGWAAWVVLHRSPVNGGFAYGNNLAVKMVMNGRFAEPDGDTPSRTLFWLLNPDTLVRPGAIRAVLRFLHANPQVGVIGTAIDDQDGRRWPYAFRFFSLLGEIENALRWSVATRVLVRFSGARAMTEQPARVDWVSGASMVVRRAVFKAAGLFDEEYFLYFEETDFAVAVARTGWECWYVPDAVVIHIAGQSTGVTGSDAHSRRVPPYWFASRRRYLVKNHGRARAILADLVVIAGVATWRLRCWASARPHRSPPFFLRDLLASSSLIRRSIRANPALATPCDRPRTGIAFVPPVAEG
jgi:N-acetylglucosaminyl-diphospho-decaprenol L-rhamnosyltransferase